MHLQELMDYVGEAASDGKLVNVPSLDIDGAVGAVPHQELILAVGVAGVEPYSI